MGCWNVSCAITRLPILKDEEVVCFSRYGKFTDFIHNITSMYYGKYNEYGGLKSKKKVFDLKHPISFDTRIFYIKKSVLDVIFEMDFSDDYVFRSGKERIDSFLEFRKQNKNNEFVSQLYSFGNAEEFVSVKQLKIFDVISSDVIDSLLKLYSFSNRCCFENGGQHDKKNVEYYKKFIKIYTKEVSKL